MSSYKSSSILYVSILFLLLFSSVSLHSQTEIQPSSYTLTVESNHDFNLEKYGIFSIQTARMEFIDSVGESNLSTYTYLLVKIGRWHQPIIVDGFDGHTAEFIFQRNENQKIPPLLLMRYHTGAHTHAMKAYSVEKNNLRNLDWDLPTSTLGYIKFEDNSIFIRESMPWNNEKGEAIIEDVYEIVAERVVHKDNRLVKE